MQLYAFAKEIYRCNTRSLSRVQPAGDCPDIQEYLGTQPCFPHLNAQCAHATSLLVPHHHKVVLDCWARWCWTGVTSWAGVSPVGLVWDWLGCWTGVSLVTLVVLWLCWYWSGWTGVGLVGLVWVWLCQCWSGCAGHSWEVEGAGHAMGKGAVRLSWKRQPRCIKQISSAGKALFLIIASLKRGLHYPRSFYTKIQQQQNLLIRPEGDKPL